MKVHSWKTYLFYREHYLQFKRTIMIELKNKIEELFDLKNDESKVTYLLDKFIDEIKGGQA